MEWSAEHQDLSLLPYLTSTEKEALRRAGIRTMAALAALKDFEPGSKIDLIAAQGRKAQVKQLAATWPVGPRLDELVHRARNFVCFSCQDDTQALGYIPGKGNSPLPVSTPELNANLVRVFIDAQHDYLDDRVYLLGALVVACKEGAPVGKTAVVRMTDGPPDSAAKEKQLFVEWTRELVQAIVDLAHAIRGNPSRANATRVRFLAAPGGE